MKIALATDHTGFSILGELELFLESIGHHCQNYGPRSFDPGDDYPDFMFAAARAVSDGECEAGIILGGSGQGEAMAANRLKGIRCSVFYGPLAPKAPIDAEGDVSHDPYEIIRLTREHNHSNMLSLASRFMTVDEMKQAIKLWLDTPYSDTPHHVRRVHKLDELA